MNKPHIDTLRHRIGLAANCEPVELLAIVLDCLAGHDSRLAALEAKPAVPTPAAPDADANWKPTDDEVDAYCNVRYPAYRVIERASGRMPSVGSITDDLSAARKVLGVPALEARMAQAEADRAELLGIAERQVEWDNKIDSEGAAWGEFTDEFRRFIAKVEARR